MSLCPMRVILPSRSRPPLECCLGVSPTQAAKSRPLANVSGAGAKVTSAVADLLFQRLDSPREFFDLGEQRARQLRHGFGQQTLLSFDERREAAEMRDAGRGDDAKLGQVTAQGVDRLRALPNEEIPRPVRHGRRFGNCLGIRRVVLLPLLLIAARDRGGACCDFPSDWPHCA